MSYIFPKELLEIQKTWDCINRSSLLYYSHDTEAFIIVEEVPSGIVRKIVDASSLMKIMQMPDTLMNRKLEIIVLLVDDNQKGSIQESKDVSGLSEITQSLMGSIPISDITIERIKEERLRKYESNIS